MFGCVRKVVNTLVLSKTSLPMLFIKQLDVGGTVAQANKSPHLRASLPAGAQAQVWPDVISQSSPHLFSSSLPVITSLSCPNKGIKRPKIILKKKKKKDVGCNFIGVIPVSRRFVVFPDAGH